MAKGLLNIGKIGYADFKVDLIPLSNKTSRPGEAMTPKYITVHNTGNSRKGADAESHTEYVDTVTGYISWHFTVDDELIYQELPTTEHGWHAGDGRGPGNMESIGIEVCEHEGINWGRAKYNAIQLIVHLMDLYDIPLENVVPHQKWSGKYCPHKILDEGWSGFVDLIREARLESMTKKETPSTWAQKAYAWAVAAGVTDGTRPKEQATREEVVTIAYNQHKATVKAIIDALERATR